jgi:hypothetical protein
MNVPSTEGSRVLFFFTFRIRISRDAGVTYCHDKQRTVVLQPVLVMNMFFSLVPCTRSINACTPRTSMNQPQALPTCACLARTLRAAAARDDRGCSLLFCMGMRKLQGFCCVVACGISPHSASDSIIHLHQPRSPFPTWQGPLKDPAAPPGCSNIWDSTAAERDHYLYV